MPRHSPSLCAQSKRCGEVLGLGRGQGLGEAVGHRVVPGAGRGTNEPRFDDLVMVHVDVPGLRAVLVAAWGRNGCW